MVVIVPEVARSTFPEPKVLAVIAWLLAPAVVTEAIVAVMSPCSLDRETPMLLSPVVETVPVLTRVMSPSRLSMPMPLAAKPEVETSPWFLTRMSPVWLVAGAEAD
ncbi:hypothetical protein D3C72_901820 [compost metagenome]